MTNAKRLELVMQLHDILRKSEHIAFEYESALWLYTRGHTELSWEKLLNWAKYKDEYKTLRDKISVFDYMDAVEILGGRL